MVDDKVGKEPVKAVPTAAEPAKATGATSAGYSGGGYGKKPMWFWVVLYVVLGAVVYYAVYALYFKKSASSSGLYGSSSTSGSLYGN